MKEEQITFLVQGAEYIQDSINYTKILIETLRAKFSNSKIIFSTWEGTNNIYPNDILIIKNTDPGPLNIEGAKFLNNFIRQIKSTKIGIDFVETKYTIKLRSDVKIDANLLSNKIAELNIMDDKIFFFLESIPLRPFMFDDKIQLAKTESIKQLWNNRFLENINENTILDLTKKFSHTKIFWFEKCNAYIISPEQVLLISFAQVNNYNINSESLFYQIFTYLQFINNNFSIQTKTNFGFSSFKNSVNKSIFVNTYSFFLKIKFNLLLKSFLFYLLLHSSLFFENFKIRVNNLY